MLSAYFLCEIVENWIEKTHWVAWVLYFGYLILNLLFVTNVLFVVDNECIADSPNADRTPPDKCSLQKWYAGSASCLAGDKFVLNVVEFRLQYVHVIADLFADNPGVDLCRGNIGMP